MATRLIYQITPHGYTQKLETPRTQTLQKIGAFVTADEVAKDIQCVVRNHPEKLGGARVNPGLAKLLPFFLAFPVSGGGLGTKL